MSATLLLASSSYTPPRETCKREFSMTFNWKRTESTSADVNNVILFPSPAKGKMGVNRKIDNPNIIFFITSTIKFATKIVS
jgi:hypothetical protein